MSLSHELVASSSYAQMLLLSPNVMHQVCGIQRRTAELGAGVAWRAQRGRSGGASNWRLPC